MFLNLLAEIIPDKHLFVILCGDDIEKNRSQNKIGHRVSAGDEIKSDMEACSHSQNPFKTSKFTNLLQSNPKKKVLSQNYIKYLD